MVSFKFLQKTNITSDQTNLQYVMDTLNIIRSWSIPQYEDPKLIIPELPHNSNIGIKFNYNIIGTPDDHNVFTLETLNDTDNRYIDFTYNEFKQFIVELVRHGNQIGITIGNKVMNFGDDYILISEIFELPITIPRESVNSIHYVWQPITNFDLHFHMNTPPDDYFGPEEDWIDDDEEWIEDDDELIDINDEDWIDNLPY